MTEVEAEAPVGAATRPDTIPGMPLTTTMPIAIPMADVDPIGVADEIVGAARLPRWGRDSKVDPLFPALPSSPDEIPNRASYADSIAGGVPTEEPGALGTTSIPPPPPPPPVDPGPSQHVAKSVEPSASPSRGADREGGLTPSGFRRRKRGHEGAPVAVSPVQSDDAPSESPHRDADTVQASLARFRAGVTQGRAVVGQADDPSGADDGDDR